MPCVHFVGFRDNRYHAAVKVWGRPDFIHRWWDRRARREIDFAADTIVFADGAHDQTPRPYNAPDIDEEIDERCVTPSIPSTSVA